MSWLRPHFPCTYNKMLRFRRLGTAFLWSAILMHLPRSRGLFLVWCCVLCELRAAMKAARERVPSIPDN